MLFLASLNVAVLCLGKQFHGTLETCAAIARVFLYGEHGYTASFRFVVITTEHSQHHDLHDKVKGFHYELDGPQEPPHHALSRCLQSK